MKKLAHFCGIMLAATSFMFQSCDDSDGYSIGDIAVDWATVEAKDSHTYSLTGDTWGTLWPAASYSIRCMMIFKDMIALSR